MNPAIRSDLPSAAWMLGLAVAQVMVSGLISLGGAVPDLVLIGIVAIGIRRGHIPATLFGFATGLLLDLYSGEVVGIGALAKSIAGFAAGYAHDDERMEALLKGPRFVLITAVCALLHQTVAVFAYLQSTDVRLLEIALLYGAGSAVYTVLFSALPPLVLSRRRTVVSVQRERV